MKKVYGVLCGMLCLGLVACGGSAAPELAEESVTLEYGENPYEDVQLESIIKDYDKIKEDYEFSVVLKQEEEEIKAESINEDQLLAVGDYTLEIKYGENVEPLQLPVKVEDTTAPEFKDFKDKVSVEYGYKKDLAKLFQAEDLSDVNVRIDGEVNVEKAGDYPVKVIAEDVNGNKTEKECTITVKEKPKAQSNNNAAGGSTASKPSSGTSGNSGSSGSGSTGSSGSTSSSGTASGSSSASGSTSSGSSSSGSSSSGGTQACYVPDDQIGNSGKIFATEQEAYEYGKQYQSENEYTVSRYFYGSIFDTCNNIVGYGVDFIYYDTPIE